MNIIFVVFALPWNRPGDRYFLAAYSTREAAQRLVDAQRVSVRENLRVVEIEIDRPPASEDFWVIPE